MIVICKDCNHMQLSDDVGEDFLYENDPDYIGWICEKCGGECKKNMPMEKEDRQC